MIYDIKSKELRQTLDGSGTPIFRPNAKGSADDTNFVQHENLPDTIGDAPSYTIISSIPSSEPRTRTEDRLILWELDRNGRLLTEEEPVDASDFATKAIEAILPALKSEHEWSREFIAESNVHAEFAKALSKASADHRRRHNTIFKDAQLPSFLTAPFNSSGSMLLYIINNRTTQHGMRHPDALPHVILYDVDNAQEIHRLKGHTDYVTWVGFSPDDRHVASVSWDGTLRVYSSQTGELEWASPTSGGQSWAGAFSFDSKYIVWSSRGGRDIKVHSVSNGEVCATFSEALSRWCQHLMWHPRDHQIVLCEGKNVWIWQPFDGRDGVLAQRWILEEGEGAQRMSTATKASWIDDGRVLYLTTSDGTIIVYDTSTNVKEMFKRPSGTKVAHVKSNFYKLPGEVYGSGRYLSVDGDGKVRYWNRSVAQADSLVAVSHREGFDEESSRISATRKDGRVERAERESVQSVTRGEDKKDAVSNDMGREGWAEEGASIWTAQ